MNKTEYYKELSTYYLTDYDFRKNIDLQTEKLKESTVEMLEKLVNSLKEKVPKHDKTGKVVRLRIAN